MADMTKVKGISSGMRKGIASNAKGFPKSSSKKASMPTGKFKGMTYYTGNIVASGGGYGGMPMKKKGRKGK